MASGTVEDLLVAEDIGIVKIRETESGEVVSLLIWSYLVQEDTPENRMLHTMFLSLLRDALVHRLPVLVNENDDGTMVLNVSVSRV
jgi:hypothetical protein